MNGAQKKHASIVWPNFFWKIHPIHPFMREKRSTWQRLLRPRKKWSVFFRGPELHLHLSNLGFKALHLGLQLVGPIPLALKAIYCNWNRTDLYFWRSTLQNKAFSNQKLVIWVLGMSRFWGLIQKNNCQTANLATRKPVDIREASVSPQSLELLPV